MKRCPITYEIIAPSENYSKRGLHLLSPKLEDLKPLALSAAEQRMEAVARAGKMSIQGVQTKLSAELKIKDECFNIVDSHGHYILKTQSEYYPELPENEAITMTLAAMINIEVPLHGLIYAKDHSFTYFIKRFDRKGHKQKMAVEDFTQLLGLNRDTKYESSMEKAATVIMQFCTFPKIELAKFFKLCLFNFLIGNEDMHLKNFSLMTRGNIITLSPAYDLLNSTIAQKKSREEIALPINGKKNNLKKNDLLHYFGEERLGLNNTVIQGVLQEFQTALPEWEKMIMNSFLSATMKEKYISLIQSRCRKIEL